MTEALAVRIDTRFAAIPERLGKREDSKITVLSSMAEAVIFGALIGFEYQRRLPISEARKDPIDFVIFQRNRLDEYAYLIAVTASKELSILSAGREQEVIHILEEYANGGFALLEEWSGDGESALISTILKKMDAKVAENLEQIKPEVKVSLKKRRKGSET